MQGYSTDGDALIAEEPRHKTMGSGAQQEHEQFKSESIAQKNNFSKKLERHTMSLWLAFAFAVASIFI